MKKFFKTIASITAAVMLLGSTVLAGPSDTYSNDPELKGTNDYYELLYANRGYNGQAFQVDHYHGDTASVVVYQFYQNDISIMGATGRMTFWCKDGKGYFYLPNDPNPELVTKFPLIFEYESIDGNEVDNIDGNPIYVWEFSVKPGTYLFGGDASAGNFGSSTLGQNHEWGTHPFGPYDQEDCDRDIAEWQEYLAGGGTLEQWNLPANYFEELQRDVVDPDEYVTLEAGDVVYIYNFVCPYDNNGKIKDKTDQWEEDFRQWAINNDIRMAEEKRQSAEPDEVIPVTQESQEVVSDPVETTQTPPPEVKPTEEAPVIQPIGTPAPEEKKSNAGPLIGGGIVLILLIVIGIWATKKK